MDLSSSSSSCSSGKRKRINTIGPQEAKRLKTEQGGDEELQCGRPSDPPRVSVLPERLRQPISLSELTELLRYAALGKTAGIKRPSWCRLHHQRKVQGVSVVIVEGLTQSHFYKHYLTLQHLRTKYSTRFTFTPTPDNIASGIFGCEVPKAECFSVKAPETQLQKALKSHPVISRFGMQRRGLTAYLLSQEERIKKHFPVKGMPGFEEFVCTESTTSVTDLSPLYGLDCEMCLTEKGYELTRVSLVDSAGMCLLDELVKPHNRILNYLTNFSGITAAMLEPVTTTLRHVQAKLTELLPGDAVLVGHSINNDLSALKLIHEHVIDTSLLYRKEFGQKFKLKVLTEIILKRQIQTEENKGHNPVEDALAALELAQYFIRTGPGQVVEDHLEDLWGYTIEDKQQEEETSSHVEPAPTPSHRLSDVLQIVGRSVSYSGRRCDIGLHLSKQQWYNSDREILASFRRQKKTPFFSVIQFSSFSNHLKRLSPHEEQHYENMCADVRDMCVVFAGPFPASFPDREVRRLFGRCGPIRKITMLNGVHAKVEFELLEGATLAVKTLNGLNILGQSIKVRRPVHEGVLDLDATLDALTSDTLNSSLLYVVRVKRNKVEYINSEVNGHTLESENSDGKSTVSNGFRTGNRNSEQSQLIIARSKLCEETLRETFSRFGVVENVILSAKAEKQARHAYIKFERSEVRDAALSSTDDLQRENYLICPSLTPLHLPSWLNSNTAEEEETTHSRNTSQDEDAIHTIRKLDRRLGKLFRFLPDGTLSVVLLSGYISANVCLPGLCLMEVK